jgi:hypothetical protein
VSLSATSPVNRTCSLPSKVPPSVRRVSPVTVAINGVAHNSQQLKNMQGKSS